MSDEREPAGSRTIAVIGAGRVGTAVAVTLRSRGYTVAAVHSRSAEDMERAARLTGGRPTDDPAEAAGGAEIIFMTTPDDAIEEVCARIAASGIDLSGKKFIHMSGALSLSALEPAREKGALTASIHPMQTFADLEGAMDAMPGSRFGVTCSPGSRGWALSLVEDLGGRAMTVKDGDRVLYHAAATIACNLLVMVEHAALSLYVELGLEPEEALEAMMPLVRGTVRNIEKLGPTKALTGPLARGDTGTVRAHLEALRRLDPRLAELYRMVSLQGLEILRERGDLADRAIDEIRHLLGSGTPSGA